MAINPPSQDGPLSDCVKPQQGDISCAYRLSQDGLRTMLPYITKQVIRPTAAEMLRVLKDRYISVNKDEVAPVCRRSYFPIAPLYLCLGLPSPWPLPVAL